MYSEVLLQLNNKLPLILCHFFLVMFLQAINWPSWYQRDQSVFLLEVSSWQDAWISTDWNSHTACILPGFFQFLVIVLNWLDRPQLDVLFTFLFLNRWLSTFSLKTTMGVPTFKTPDSTSTPNTIGSDFLKVATCLRTHGKIASLPYFCLLISLTSSTYLKKKSVKW